MYWVVFTAIFTAAVIMTAGCKVGGDSDSSGPLPSNPPLPLTLKGRLHVQTDNPFELLGDLYSLDCAGIAHDVSGCNIPILIGEDGTGVFSGECPAIADTIFACFLNVSNDLRIPVQLFPGNFQFIATGNLHIDLNYHRWLGTALGHLDEELSTALVEPVQMPEETWQDALGSLTGSWSYACQPTGVYECPDDTASEGSLFINEFRVNDAKKAAIWSSHKRYQQCIGDGDELHPKFQVTISDQQHALDYSTEGRLATSLDQAIAALPTEVFTWLIKAGRPFLELTMLTCHSEAPESPYEPAQCRLVLNTPHNLTYPDLATGEETSLPFPEYYQNWGEVPAANSSAVEEREVDCVKNESSAYLSQCPLNSVQRADGSWYYPEYFKDDATLELVCADDWGGIDNNSSVYIQMPAPAATLSSAVDLLNAEISAYGLGCDVRDYNGVWLFSREITDLRAAFVYLLLATPEDLADHCGNVSIPEGFKWSDCPIGPTPPDLLHGLCTHVSTFKRDMAMETDATGRLIADGDDPEAFPWNYAAHICPEELAQILDSGSGPYDEAYLVARATACRTTFAAMTTSEQVSEFFAATLSGNLKSSYCRAQTPIKQALMATVSASCLADIYFSYFQDATSTDQAPCITNSEILGCYGRNGNFAGKMRGRSAILDIITDTTGAFIASKADTTYEDIFYREIDLREWKLSARITSLTGAQAQADQFFGLYIDYASENFRTGNASAKITTNDAYFATFSRQ